MRRAAYREGELLVRFRREAQEHEKNSLLTSIGARPARALRGESRLERLELRAGQNLEVIAAQLRLRPSVEIAEPNYIIQRDDLTPNDPRFAEQWALRNEGASGGQPGSDIGAAAAWEESIGDASIVIAVVDSGVDFSHPDLAPNRWANTAERDNGRDDDRNGLRDDLHGWDWITDSGTVRDEQGHGTAVAGLIAARGDNRVGTSGVMWRAGLMSLRVLDSAGTGSIADAVEAIDYAAAKGAHVINCSWGTGGESSALRDAIERAGRRGAVVVTSAGNGGSDIDAAPYFPASFNLPNLITVTSTDGSDNLASWANWGASGVMVAAPGVGLLTTTMGGGYETVTGTSASAPLVSGIAGLLKTTRPWAPASGVKSAVSDGARDVAGLLNKVSSGGVAHAAGALRALRTQPVPPGWSNGNDPAGGPPAHWPAQPGFGAGGTGPNGDFTVPARARSRDSVPANGLPNLDEARRGGGAPTSAPAPIQANLCRVTDPDCSGGGSTEPPGADPDFSTQRVQPQNATGLETGAASNHHEGVNLGSQNFNWGLSLLHLRGRAGLDLNLNLHYNSLLWTKQGTRIRYNTDRGWPGPGFRLGFPALQRLFINEETGSYSYMLVDESGGRTELRRKGAFNTYDAADGSNVQMVEYYQLVARHSGKCLDVSGAGQGNGQGLHQWDCVGAANQQWQIVPTSDGYFRLLARHSAKVVDVAGAGAANGAVVHQWEYVGGANQQWQFVSVGSGYYKIVARHSGKALTVYGGDLNNGTHIDQWDYIGNTNQQWQLVAVPGQKVVRNPDGTQFTFAVAAGGDFKCTEIKDRNGNYITITYHTGGTLAGQIDTVTDTLGRVVTFGYYPDGNLEKITQARANGATYQWAKFYYSSVYFTPSFPGLTVYRPSGEYITALSRVDRSDGSYVTFDYGYPSWGVVTRINQYRSDAALASYVSYNIPPTSTPHSDSPRFTEQREWVRDWNGDVDGVPAAAEEVLTAYAVTPDVTWTMPHDGSQHTGTRTQVTTPDGTVHKTFAKAAGWQAGLPMLEEVWGAGSASPDKKTATVWTQDDTNLLYPANPRVHETHVYSAGGHRRTAYMYGSYNLVAAIFEYGPGGSPLVRQTNFAYDLHPNFVDRRIIGLQSAKEVYKVEGITYTMVARTTNTYDSTPVQNPGTVARHDGAFYGGGFGHGRGNLTAVHRFDAGAPYDLGTASVNTTTYDIAGSPVETADHLNHRTLISYADAEAFSDGVNRNAFAYPASATDPDQVGQANPKRMTTKYDYHSGSVTRMQDQKGAI